MDLFTKTRSTAHGRLVLGLVILASGGLLGAGCGGGDSSTIETPATGTTSTSDKGGTTGDSAGASSATNTAAIAIFNSSGCAGCHTLSVADASGAIGPNLDTTSLSKAEIETQIRNGGGGMSPYEGQLSDAEISTLAELISTSN
ncbi:MAG: cytochrome c [Solirubrobacterales bacterium]